MMVMNRLRLLGSVLLLVSGTACTTLGFKLLNARADGAPVTLTTHAYGALSEQALDIYNPDAAPASPRDVVVFLYGGKWETGRRGDYYFVATRLAREGYIVVIPDYRKYPEVRFPAFVEDAALALSWVHQHIAEYGGNPQAVHLSGHSAGAHIGALLVSDQHYLGAQGLSVAEAVKDFAGIAGPYHFTPEDEDLKDMFGPPERYPLMQATSFIEGDEPPMLLLHGEKDEDVGAINHEKLAARIRQKRGRVEVITYPTLDHIDVLSTFSKAGPNSELVNDMVRFFRTGRAHD